MTTTLYADTTNGIMRHGDDQYVTDFVDAATFVRELPTLKDGEYLKCDEITVEIERVLESEYGIH